MKAVLNSFRVKEGHCLHSLGNQLIAAYARERGQNVKLLSIPLDTKKATSMILSENPDLCGLSCNYVTEPIVIEIIKNIKEERNIPIVIGGPSVTYSTNESKIRQSDADLFVRGDGEEAFFDIISNLNNIDDLINGIKIIEGVSSKQKPNESLARVRLEDMPSPFPLGFETDHVYWETTRGCIFNCIYCAHPGKSKDAKFVPMSRLEKEVEYMSKKGLKAIYITDPILGGTKERSKMILRLLSKIKGPFITAEYRPEFLDEEIMNLIENAKIGWLEVGLQTTNPKLSYFRKNALNVLRYVERFGKRKIPYVLDLIAGIPGDTSKGFEESLRFAVEDAKPTRINIFPLRIYDGTILHLLANKNSWEYDPHTRIIKNGGSFKEKEFLEWMKLGTTTTLLYRFLNENGWFGDELKYRDFSIFRNFANNCKGNNFKDRSDYNPKLIEELWRKNG